MATFQKRAKQAMKVGDLTVSDLRHWFDRPYTTVWRWVNSGWEPGLLGTRKKRTKDGVRAETDLALLERAIAAKLLPLPEHVGPGNDVRPALIRNIYHAAGRARLPQAHSSK